MADAIVSSLLTLIMESLNSQVLKEVGRVWGLNTDLENIESTLNTIQAVLHDAEEKQWKSEAVKNWLKKLKDVAYDVDDVLDEFTIELQQRHLKNRARYFFSLDHNPLVFRVKMVRSLKNVREKVDVIASDINKFGLIARGGDTAPGSYNWRLTSSLVNESEIHGRVKEKDDLINMLLANSNHDISIYAICGMGGIGKTTLAQLICNDGRITGHFDLQIWVCVSIEFDLKRLTKTIIESIEGTSPNIQELDTLQRHLQKKLLGKRFLVILDDVLDVYDDRWNKLKEVFRYGAAGSAILITTRIEMVASRMATSFVHHMGRLSEEDSWLLFQRLALGMRRQEEYACLEAIGKSIVKKCGRVPLAITALGNLMRLKETEGEWLAVKKSEIWDLKEEGSMILPALRLSYDNLPPHLKQCFAFCSIFPKDYVLVKEQLIALWMANGFISSRVRMDLHEAGHEIFNELVGRSFFQEVIDDGMGNMTCKMHDLIHDLAQSIAAQECCCLMEGDGQLEIPKSIRHVAVYGRSLAPPKEKLLKVLSLRSFFKYEYRRRSYRGVLSGQKQLRALGALGISSYSSLEFIGNLKHLRHLDLSKSFMRTLPESITSLKKLQTLNLRGCSSLRKLPKGMRKMKSLVYLDIRGCNALHGMPVGMGELSCLRKLSIFIVGKEDGRHISELEKLNLGGELSIKDLDFVKNITDGKKANLMGKINLRSLSLSWSIEEDVVVEKHEEVLCGLQPHKNLKKLVIEGYGGSKFPNWMMDLSLQLPNLAEVKLSGCPNCQQRPSFGKLQFLKHLTIYKMDGVKYLESDVFGDEHHLFPSLETLQLGSVMHLEKWVTVGGVRQCFPRLKEVAILDCPSLVELPNLCSIKKLTIKGDCTYALLRSVRNLTSLIQLTLHWIPNLMHLPDGMLQNHTLLEHLTLEGLLNLKSWPDQIFDDLSVLRNLNIKRCENLEKLPEDGLRNVNSLETLYIKDCYQLKSLPRLCGLSSLQSLFIHDCPNLICLPESIQHLASLQFLDIEFCQRLSSLPDQIESLASLSKLYIYDCPNLMCLPESIQNLTSLRFLQIARCQRLSSLPNQIGSLTSLSELHLGWCSNLMSLTDGMRNLTMLNKLHIIGCPNLERRCKKDSVDDWPKIAHIPNIKIDDRVIQGSWD